MGDRVALLTVTGTTTMGQKRIEKFPYFTHDNASLLQFIRSTKTRPITLLRLTISALPLHTHTYGIEWLSVALAFALIPLFQRKIACLCCLVTGQIAKMHTFYSANVTSRMACFGFDFCHCRRMHLCVCVCLGGRHFFLTIRWKVQEITLVVIYFDGIFHCVCEGISNNCMDLRVGACVCFGILIFIHLQCSVVFSSKIQSVTRRRALSFYLSLQFRSDLLSLI